MIKIGFSVKKHPFWLSFLGHVVLFFIFLLYASLNQNLLTEREMNPEIYVPSFLTPSVAAAKVESAQTKMKPPENEVLAADGELALQKMIKPIPQLDHFIAQERYHPTQAPQEDPVHLIGEKLKDDPLRHLLGVALTRHLIYPKAAKQLQLRGIVSVELLLYPNGEIGQIKLLQSSKESLLDVAALNAIHAMSPLANIDLYVKEPKSLVFNVIFR